MCRSRAVPPDAKLEVPKPIVVSQAVPMMDFFVSFQGAAEKSFHLEPVLENLDVPVPRNSLTNADPTRPDDVAVAGEAAVPPWWSPG